MTDRPSIEAVLDHYGSPRRGRKVSCPLHDDKTPSCSVDYNRDLFKCHSCGVGGDSWTLIQKMEAIDFGAAREFAAAQQLAASESGDGDGELQQGTYGRHSKSRGDSPTGKRDKPGGGKYIPAWRRK